MWVAAVCIGTQRAQQEKKEGERAVPVVREASPAEGDGREIDLPSPDAAGGGRVAAGRPRQPPAVAAWRLGDGLVQKPTIDDVWSWGTPDRVGWRGGAPRGREQRVHPHRTHHRHNAAALHSRRTAVRRERSTPPCRRRGAAGTPDPTVSGSRGVVPPPPRYPTPTATAPVGRKHGRAHPRRGAAYTSTPGSADRSSSAPQGGPALWPIDRGAG